MAKDQLKSDCPTGFKWEDAINGEIKFASIYFAYNNHELTKDDKDIIDLLVEYVGRTIQHSQDVEIKFTGHTDKRGTRGFNLGLSQRRIDSVKDYFSGQLEQFKIKEDKVVNYLPFVKPFELSEGEKNARFQKRYWDEDRRVDISVRLQKKTFTKERLEWRE